jgi:uncharacterized protein YggL (DUF469 family)
MNKRIRKKKRLGEFRESGCEVAFGYEGEPDAILDAMNDFLEAHGLMCGGGGHSGTLRFHVTRICPHAMTTEHRAALEAWLANDARVPWHEVGPVQLCDPRNLCTPITPK